MLEIKNIKAGYNGMEILHGVDLELGTGEIMTIIGPNGSGKSTILKSIFNLCSIYSGKIIWKNIDITKLKPYNKIYEGISYVPQGRQVFQDMTVEENLEMGGFIFSNRNLLKTNIRSVYQKFPFLEKKKNDYADSLSGGQQQMLSIGRALMQNPELLLLDEPSLGLSPKASQEVFEKVKEINSEGVRIIIVEQNVKQAIEISDRVYVLESGNIALEGDKNIINNKKIKEIYFGKN